MPSVNSITLLAADLSDSSVDETYSIVDRKEGVTTFRYTGTNPLALASRFTVKVMQPKADSKYAKVILTFVKPEVYTDAATTQIEQSLIDRVNIEFQLDKNATLAQITSCADRALAFLKDSSVMQAVTNVEGYY